MLTNKKYLKNFKKHRDLIFLSPKILFYNKSDFFLNRMSINKDKKEFYKLFEKKNKNYTEKKKFTIHDFLQNSTKIENLNEKENFNFDKFVNFMNIVKITNRINYNLFINFLLKFFKYSYLIKFSFELLIIMVCLVYCFKTGTFY